MTTERRGAARLLRNVALVDHPLPFHANRAWHATPILYLFEQRRLRRPRIAGFL